MLTARQVKDVALGEWSRYFGWRIYSKWKWLPTLTILLIVLSISFMIIATSISSQKASLTLVNVPISGTIDINTLPYNGVISIYQDGVELPTLDIDNVVTDTDRAHNVLNVIAMIILFVAGVLLVLWIGRYQEDKLNYAEYCVQKWINSDFKQIPDKQSVIDFIAKE